MSHQTANAFILGPLLVATVLFGIWAAIDIYRMSRYSKRVKLYAANYSRAIIAHSIPGNDLANDPDFQRVATVVNDPVPEYRNTWPRRGTL